MMRFLIICFYFSDSKKINYVIKNLRTLCLVAYEDNPVLHCGIVGNEPLTQNMEP